MSALDNQTLTQLARDNAVIITTGSGPCPVFARGDRRTVATHWLSRKIVKALESEGTVVKVKRGLSLAPTVSNRLLNPVQERAFSEQNGRVTTRKIYTPDGGLRNHRVNTSFNVLRRMGMRRGRDGTPLLSASLIEAGERFARDYHAGSTVGPSTQNYSGPNVDGGSRHDAQARKYARQIDSKNRLKSARKALGPKLERIVIAVCCNNHDLDALERAEGWAKRSGLVVLRLGLETLRDHYGTQAGRN